MRPPAALPRGWVPRPAVTVAGDRARAWQAWVSGQFPQGLKSSRFNRKCRGAAGSSPAGGTPAPYPSHAHPSRAPGLR